MKNHHKEVQQGHVSSDKPKQTQLPVSYRRSSSLDIQDEESPSSSPSGRKKSTDFIVSNTNSLRNHPDNSKKLKKLARPTNQAQRTIHEAMTTRSLFKPWVRKVPFSKLKEGDVSPSAQRPHSAIDTLQVLPEEHEQFDRSSQQVLLPVEIKIQDEAFMQPCDAIQQEFVPGLLENVLQITEKEQAFSRIANKKIGSFFTGLTDVISRMASAGKLTQEQLKSEFCWNTVSFMLDICEAYDLIGIHDNVKDRSKMIEKIDSQIRKILEFLETKYLPITEMGTSQSQLVLKFRGIEHGQEDCCDILGASGFSRIFTHDKEDYSADIKMFLNALIRETKKTYPLFTQELQQVFNEMIGESQSQEETAKIEFFATFDESTEQYKSNNLKTVNLNTKNANLLRLCITWAMELYDTILNAEDYINKLTSFKSINRGQNITLTKKRRETLINHLKQVGERILNIRTYRWQILNNLTIELLLCVLRGFRGHESLDRKEVMIAKISQYIHSSLESNVLVTLNLQINVLNSIRKQYDHEVLESSIDLITFSQPDILKCRMIGSRSQIYLMYKTLLKRKGKLTILQMKNRLETPSRDILINIKIKGSFLVCQVQLILDNSFGHLHMMSNLISNIRQARLPILHQCCNILVQLEDYISYFDDKHPVVFIGYDLDFSLLEFKKGGVFCRNKHHPQEMVHISNKLPFLCRACNIFYKSMSFGVKFLSCQGCLMTLCPKCVLNKWQGYQQVMINMYVNNAFLREFCDMPAKGYGFWSKNELMLQSLKVVDEGGYLLLLQCDYKSVKMRIVKQYEGQFIDAFLNLRQLPRHQAYDSQNNWCSIIKFKPTEIISLSSLTLYLKIQIDMPWHEFEQMVQETQNDQVVVCINDRKVALIMDMPLAPTEINCILQQISLEKSIQRELSKDEIHLQLSSRNLQNLSILGLIRNKQTLNSLNLWQNKLLNVQSLAVFTNLQELYLRQNAIEDITPLLQLSNLQQLNLQRNKLNGKFPKIHFPRLKSLDISCNQLRDVSNLSDSHLSSLTVLMIGVNMLEELPVLNCPHLHTYFFAMNRITSLRNLCKSQLPKAKIIHGYKNRLIGALPLLNLPHLSELWLLDNFIDNIDSLASAHMQYFETLKINSNRIKGRLPILKMPNLTNIHLEGNDIDSIDALTSWQTPKLKCLYLASNRISDQLPIFNFKHLTVLDLSRNKLTNIENLTLARIRNIQEIKLGYNQICGTLPIIKFFKLTRLELQMNRIDDVMTLSMCILPEIIHMDLSQNHIRTSIPIMQFQNLQEIRLYENAIQSLLFLKESQLLPSLEAIIIHPSELVMLPEEEAKLRSYRFRDDIMGKAVRLERRMTCSQLIRPP